MDACIYIPLASYINRCISGSDDHVLCEEMNLDLAKRSETLCFDKPLLHLNKTQIVVLITINKVIESIYPFARSTTLVKLTLKKEYCC